MEGVMGIMNFYGRLNAVKYFELSQASNAKISKYGESISRLLLPCGNYPISFQQKPRFPVTWNCWPGDLHQSELHPAQCPLV